MPSGEVITRLPVPVSATAAKRNRLGDQQTDFQPLSAALVRAVQVFPSGLVITRLPVPEAATATKILRDGDQQTSSHALSAALVSVDHTVPAEASAAGVVSVSLLIICWIVPVESVDSTVAVVPAE
jgi:hypothetical protein